MCAFIDDTSITLSQLDMNRFRCELSSVDSWMKMKKVSLITEKTKIIHFNRSNCDLDNKMELDGEIIEHFESFQRLGLKLDTKRCFHDHVENVTQRIHKYCALLYRIQRLFHRKDLLQF